MAFLGSKACHEECGVRIMDYLERGGVQRERALAFDCVNLGDPDVAKGRWAAMMDATRTLAGNDKDWGGKKCVTYQHYVISPDPRDGVDLDTLRGLALDWAHEFFGDHLSPGRLGSYEVAIVYHDDNERGIPHAHVIVNNTDLDTGRRLHVGDKDVKLLTNRLQQMCEERGLSYFDDGSAQAHVQEKGRYYTKVEREIMKQGGFSWKQDIANNVTIARRLSRAEGEFVSTCERLGIKAQLRDGDYLFSHYHNEGRWKVTGYRLGRNYTRDSILSALEGNARDYDAAVARVRENVCKHVLADLFETMELAAVVEHGASVKKVAFALQVNDRYQIRSLADYDRRIAEYAARAASQRPGPKLESLREAIASLSAAKGIASRGEFFEGAELGRPARDMFAPLGPHGASGSQSGGKRAALPKAKVASQGRTEPKMSKPRGDGARGGKAR